MVIQPQAGQPNNDASDPFGTFAPLLSATIKTEAHFKKLNYPLLASTKIDGIRIILHPTYGPVTRTLKPIPNNHIREQLGFMMKICPPMIGVDGEITLGTIDNITDEDIFNKTQSAVMTQSGTPQCLYNIFDHIREPNKPFLIRLMDVKVCDNLITPTPDLRTRWVEHTTIDTYKDLLAAEAKCLADGYEGIMLRDPRGIYKHGRSTLNQNILVKLKREEHGEVQLDTAIITGFEEQETNNNVATTDALGHTKRSTHKANKVGNGMLGKFNCRVLSGKWTDTLVDVGTGEGLTHVLRKHIWENQSEYIGKTIEFSHQLRGAKEAPRFPIFKRFRDDL